MGKKDQDSAKSTAEMENPTASDIWKTLSAVNVNEHTESKAVGDRTLTYLSWAWAWTVMMEHYPQLSVKWHGMTDSDGVTRDITTYPGGTASVCCSVRIGESVKREMWLPVMNYKNQAVTNPDSFAINTAKMRCLTKAFSLFGLGAYIYAGEDLPTEAVVEAPPQKKTKTKTKAKAKAKAKPAETASEEPKGAVIADSKTRLKERCKELYASGWEADKALQGRIKKAVKGDDEIEMEALLKMLDDVMPALLTLHEE